MITQAKALREKYLARKAEEKASAADATPPDSLIAPDSTAPSSAPKDEAHAEEPAAAASPSDVRPESPKFYEIPAAFKPYVR